MAPSEWSTTATTTLACHRARHHGTTDALICRKGCAIVTDGSRRGRQIVVEAPLPCSHVVAIGGSVAEGSTAIAEALGADFRSEDPVLRPGRFADVQVNAALALSKRVGLQSRDVAAKIVERLDVSDVCAAVEISGPGFLNLTLSDAWIVDQLTAMAADPRLGGAAPGRAADPDRLLRAERRQGDARRTPEDDGRR
jgi:Arginyl tRNA synthetase N terminal domain